MKSTLALRTLCMTLMLIFSMSGAWASHHNLSSDYGGISFYDKSYQMRFRILDEEAKTVALVPRSMEDVPIGGEIKYSGDIVLPNSVTYDGQAYTLVSIGDSALNECTSLRSELKRQEQKPGVTIETALPVGSKMKLKLKYDDEITITGLEEKPTNNQEQEYTITAQSILIEGLLTELECTEAQITTLRLSDCDRLSVLDCSNNEIKELDLQEVPHLEILVCSNNQITALDLSATPDLSKLWCSNNKEIKSLDLSHATNLMALWCYGCSLSELNLSACSSLTGVDCTNNKLSKLSLGKIDYLTRVACENNQLKQIDLSGVPNLDELLCGNNSLTSLQLSAVPYLTTLKCPNNQLSTLDLTPLQDLKNLHCQGNQLSKLDLSKNKAIEELYCYENQIKGEEMTALVASLRKIPQDTYENLMLINSSAPKEQNHPMVSDIELAKAKGWTPKDFQGGINDGAGVPFEGFTSTTQITHRDRPQVALLADRTLVITEAESDTVTLYAVDGSILYCAAPSLDGVHRIQLSSMTGRTIILLIGTNSYKILVP